MPRTIPLRAPLDESGLPHKAPAAVVEPRTSAAGPDDSHVAHWHEQYWAYIEGTEDRTPERYRAEAAWYRDQAPGYTDPRVREFSLGMAGVCEAAAARCKSRRRPS
ncbi:hypothetical protein ACWD5R_39625 [Streptomyces sp. NPDC002514]